LQYFLSITRNRKLGCKHGGIHFSSVWSDLNVKDLLEEVGAGVLSVDLVLVVVVAVVVVVHVVVVSAKKR